MKNYLKSKISVGEIYNTRNFGKVKVIKQVNENNFEVSPIKPKLIYCSIIDKWVEFTDLSNNYIVNEYGHFGYCYNNPYSLTK